MNSGFQDALKAGAVIKVEPLPLVGERADAQPFPIDACGDRLARAIRAIMVRVKVPDSLAAHSVLAAASLAVQGHAVVELPTRQRRPTSLFFATIADSGDRKSSADEIAIKPIADYEIDLNTEYQMAKQVHATQAAIFKNDQAKLTKEMANADRTTVEMAVKDLGTPPIEPPRPAIIVPPGSTQGVIDMLDKGRPSLGLFINEGGSWLGSWGMQDDNRTATISNYSELWDGQSIKTLTKGEGFRFLPNRAFSFHVMFQQIYIERMFGDEEMRGQGFLSRVLAAQPTTLAGTRFHDPSTIEPAHVTDDIVEYQERLGSIIRTPLPVDLESPQNGLMRRCAFHLDEDAAALFWEFYNTVEGQQGQGGSLAPIRGFAGKATEQAARIATVLHVFENGLRDRTINKLSMARGVALMNFYLGEALRLAAATPIDPVTADALILSEWLEKKWDQPFISARRIMQSGPGKIRTSMENVRELCAVLARHDHITPVAAGANVDGKHAKEAWRVHVGR
ncbi:YfjI family protein [Sphingomonas sp. 1P06PA]|uniref:YfjI family protein n=1 Tax=Sphingomonas sp. 1P06PA TaxID=554121 RepID=UPI0039A49470